MLTRLQSKAYGRMFQIESKSKLNRPNSPAVKVKEMVRVSHWLAWLDEAEKK